jgi:ribosomal-protein-alanine N-acetyltransferase
MMESHQLSQNVSIRLLRLSDAAALTAAYVRNRAYLSCWEPVRPEEYYTVSWQAADIAKRLVASDAGETYPLALFDGDTLAGRFNVAGIVRGPFQNAGLGYWVDSDYAGRGLASAAVQWIVEMARDKLGLHRIEASTLLHNVASQRVLQKAGFQQIGMAPRYLQIAGKWQDHNLYQVVLHD